MKNKLYTFETDLKNRLKDPKFKQAWAESEPEFILAQKLIEKRLARKMSQRELAKKIKTSQAVVSRIETMQANPSLSLLKRIAVALNSHIQISFQ
jgi:DNA-binding XRE family transcriptional regulator